MAKKEPAAKKAPARKKASPKAVLAVPKKEPIRKKESPLHHGFLIHDVSRLRRTVFDQRMKPMGMTRSQWWVLTNLSRHDDDALTQIELARLLDVGKVTLGGLIDRLEENGFVIRTADANDRRSKRISVSKKGKALVEKMEAIALDINDASMQGVTRDQQQVLVEVLATMKRNLIAMNALPASTAKRSDED